MYEYIGPYGAGKRVPLAAIKKLSIRNYKETITLFEILRHYKPGDTKGCL